MSTQAGSEVRTETGETFRLGALIKSGGAGSVHRVDGRPHQVAKIYHPGIGDARYERKLVAMLALKPDLPDIRDGSSDHVQIAWPQALLRDRRGAFLGFLMPAVDVKATSELETILQERQARAHGLPTGLGAKLTLAANLAAVIAALHHEGHHVVDLKPVNLRFYPRSLYMAMLDCDGFSIRGEGERFHAPQFTPDYLAPEFQRGGLVDAGEETQDQFALAVIVFQLLNFGIHPYTGRPASERVPTDIPGRIAHGAYAYGLRPSASIKPSPVSGHAAIPDELRRLFDQAFEGGKARPTAAQWAASLRGFALRSSLRLVACSSNAEHQHFAGLACAACTRADLITRTARAAPQVRQAAATQQAAVAVAAGRKPAAPPRHTKGGKAQGWWGVAKPAPAPNRAVYTAPPPAPPAPPVPPTFLSPAARLHLQNRRRRAQTKSVFDRFVAKATDLGLAVLVAFALILAARLLAG